MSLAVSFSMGLQEDKKYTWELAITLLREMNLTNILNHKHGWQRMDEIEDTEQDLVLILFNTIQKYENKTGRIFTKLTDITDKDKQNIKNMIIGKYRKNVWLNRTDRNMRMSDFYNLGNNSNDDTALYFSTISTNDVIDEKECSFSNNTANFDMRAEICNNLFKILDTNLASMIKASMLGTDLQGILTHQEIAKANNKARSSVTRRINRGIDKISNFIKQYNITWKQINNPTEKDFQYINNIIKRYEEKLMFKKQKINANNSMLNIEYFLNINKCYIVTNKDIIKEKQPMFKVNKNKKVKTILNAIIHTHSIEEYI